MSKFSVMAGRALLKMQHRAPDALVLAGIGGMIAATVIAVKATTGDACLQVMGDKYDSLMHINRRRKLSQTEGAEEFGQYSEEQAKKDTVAVHVEAIKGYAKVYWPAATTMGISIAAILYGFKIIKGRNVALMAAYKIVDQAFKDYRGRVKDELGEEMDQHFYQGTEMRQVGTKVVENEDGTSKKVKVYEQTLNGETVSMYGRVYGPESSQYSRTNPAMNWLTIKKKLDWVNDLLRARGHVFLNEVYDELGFERTKEGAIVGWVFNQDNGDDYIDFGPWWQSLETVEEAGPGGVIVLDFNVDGVIFDKI